MRRKAGLEQCFRKDRRDGGRFAGRLDYHRVAGHQRRRRHAAENGQGEIPRRNHDADAKRQIAHFIALARQLDDGLRSGEAKHFARVIFAEIDGLGDLGFRLRPGFAGFEDQPGVELVFAFPDQRGHAEQQGNALFGVRFRPLREIPVRPLDGTPG